MNSSESQAVPSGIDFLLPKFENGSRSSALRASSASWKTQKRLGSSFSTVSNSIQTQGQRPALDQSGAKLWAQVIQQTATCQFPHTIDPIYEPPDQLLCDPRCALTCDYSAPYPDYSGHGNYATALALIALTGTISSIVLAIVSFFRVKTASPTLEMSLSTMIAPVAQILVISVLGNNLGFEDLTGVTWWWCAWLWEVCAISLLIALTVRSIQMRRQPKA